MATPFRRNPGIIKQAPLSNVIPSGTFLDEMKPKKTVYRSETPVGHKPSFSSLGSAYITASEEMQCEDTGGIVNEESGASSQSCSGKGSFLITRRQSVSTYATAISEVIDNV